MAWTEAEDRNFDFAGGSFTGNTPSNIAPIIINAGASYRFNHWPWPVEFGGLVRHVGNRYLFEDDLTPMGLVSRLEYQLDRFDYDLQEQERRAVEAETRRVGYEDRAGQEFPLQRELDAKLAALATLNADLAKTAKQAA